MDERPGAELISRPAALLDGRYRLGPVLSRGGMSTVHRGTDTRLDRPVAVKVMDPRLAADPAFRARFEREARAVARIDHPAVVDVYDQGTCVQSAERGDGEPVVFLVMELVEGGTLRDVLAARGPLGVPAAVAVLEPVLAGLAEAHRRGLVHRDVKPENVLISRTGEVKVADFGLVTAAARAGASHAGMILGTVAYLSPEQVTTGAADARSDVYAAGVMLYELLTGEPPYTGDTPISVAYRHVHDEVPPPSSVVGAPPPELDELVVRATRRDPAARPADAGAFLAALCRVAERAGVPRVRPPVPPARLEPDGAGVPTGPERVPAAAGPRGTRALPRPEVEAAPALPRRHRDERPESWRHTAAGTVGHTRSRRRSGLAFTAGVAVVTALGLLAGAGGWWLGDGRWTAMPSVVGLERTAAERLVAGADLAAAVTVARDDTVPAGLVAAVDPAPQARLPRGSTVRLTVSTGRPVVPAVVPGTGVAAAEQAVRDAGLTPVRSAAGEEYSTAVPAGAVSRTEPAAGTPLQSGTAVTLVVSRGPEPPRQVRVPLVIGRSVPDATATLAAVGLAVEVDRAFPVDRGGDAQVVQQSHRPGSMVDRDTPITLRVV